MLSKLTLKIPNKRKLLEPIFFRHLFIEAEFVNLHLSNKYVWFELQINNC